MQSRIKYSSLRISRTLWGNNKNFEMTGVRRDAQNIMYVFYVNFKNFITGVWELYYNSFYFDVKVDI